MEGGRGGQQCLLLAASLCGTPKLSPSAVVSVRARDLVHLCVTKGKWGDEQEGAEWLKAITGSVKKKQNNIHGKRKPG